MEAHAYGWFGMTILRRRIQLTDLEKHLMRQK